MYGSPKNNRKQLETLIARFREKREELERQRKDLDALLQELADAEEKAVTALDELA